MKFNRLYIPLLLLFVFQAFISVSAQTDCAAKLKYARELFDSGQIEQIPSLLDSCIQDGFTRDQKNQAYRLLIETYLFDYNRAKAEQEMLSFLKDFPEYKVQSIDPIEFTELYRAFEVKPSWTFGLNLSGTLSQVIVQEFYSTSSILHTNSKFSFGKTGFGAGVNFDKIFSPNFTLSLGLRYQSVLFQNTESLNYGTEDLIYKESSGWLSCPVNLQYTYSSRLFAPMLFIGGEAGYLLRSEAEISRLNSGNTSFPDIMSGPLNVKNQRTPYNIWISGGVGVRYKIPMGYLKLMAGYNYGFIRFTRPSENYKNLENIFYYQHIDDALLINHFFISLSYNRLLYKIRKKELQDAN